jgi:hypothetical protein
VTKEELMLTALFVCPVCGGHCFWATVIDGAIFRHCHGRQNYACSFTWPEKDDDKYFYVSVRTVRKMK